MHGKNVPWKQEQRDEEENSNKKQWCENNEMKKKKHVAYKNWCVKYALKRKKARTMKWKECNEMSTTKDAWSAHYKKGKQEQQNEKNTTKSQQQLLREVCIKEKEHKNGKMKIIQWKVNNISCEKCALKREEVRSLPH